MAPKRHARRRRVPRGFPLGLPLPALDFLLQRTRVLPLPLLDDFWRGKVDGAFAPRDGGHPVLHHDAGDGQVIVGGVGSGPVAKLADVAAFFHFAWPALDEAFGGWVDCD